jgi:hypothetical protein
LLLVKQLCCSWLTQYLMQAASANSLSSILLKRYLSNEQLVRPYYNPDSSATSKLSWHQQAVEVVRGPPVSSKNGF